MAKSVVFTSTSSFGKIEVGQSQIVTYSVKNNTSTNVRLDSNWFTGNPSSYQIVGGTCKFDNTVGFILESLKTCTLDIKFSPKVTGLQSNTLVVGYFLGTGWTWQENTISLRGEGILATTSGPTPVPVPSPTPLPNPEPAPIPSPKPTTGTLATGWLRVSGNKILNDQGQQVILKGVNIADPEALNTKQNERPGVTASSVALAATDTYHAKVIRLPILPGNPSYPSEGFFGTMNGWDVYFKKHLEPLVNALTAKGVYVIIDLHYVSDFQNLYPKVSAFWSYMAPKFANNPKVFYEIFNEPINPDNWTTWKNTIAQPIVSLIRAVAPNNLILVGGPYWSSHIEGAASNPVIGNNIAYVCHVYSNQTSSVWDQRYAAVISKYPVFVTEWGFETGGTEGGDLNWGIQFESWLSLHGLSWTVWSYDTMWGPRMVNSDWSLRKSPGGMGTFVAGLLK